MIEQQWDGYNEQAKMQSGWMIRVRRANSGGVCVKQSCSYVFCVEKKRKGRG